MYMTYGRGQSYLLFARYFVQRWLITHFDKYIFQTRKSYTTSEIRTIPPAALVWKFLISHSYSSDIRTVINTIGSFQTPSSIESYPVLLKKDAKILL